MFFLITSVKYKQSKEIWAEALPSASLAFYTHIAFLPLQSLSLGLCKKTGIDLQIAHLQIAQHGDYHLPIYQEKARQNTVLGILRWSTNIRDLFICCMCTTSFSSAPL